MPTQREWRERDAARADQRLFGQAADWLRDDPKRRRVAGLWADRVGHALADLLDALGDDVAGLDTAVRWRARDLPGATRGADGVGDDKADPAAVVNRPITGRRSGPTTSGPAGRGDDAPSPPRLVGHKGRDPSRTARRALSLRSPPPGASTRTT
jgi:hypothetical protein